MAIRKSLLNFTFCERIVHPEIKPKNYKQYEKLLSKGD